MTADIPKNHHFIPQHFLKAWASSNKKIVRYRKIAAANKFEVKESPIISTAAINELYRIKFPDGSFEIESSLVTPKVDEDGHKILDAARTSLVSEWDDVDKQRLAHYLTCLEARHPKAIEAMNIKNDLDALAETQKQEGIGSDESIDEIIAYLKSSDSLGVLALGLFIQNEKWANLNKPFSDGLLSANFREYYFKEPMLLTSNYPTSRWGNYLNDFLYVVAISPFKALVYSTSKDVDVIGLLPEYLRAKLLNLYTLAKADNAYYLNKDMSDFVEQHLGWGKSSNTSKQNKAYVSSFLTKELEGDTAKVDQECENW